MPLTPDFVEELMAVQRTLPSWEACQMESRIETYFFMFSCSRERRRKTSRIELLTEHPVQVLRVGVWCASD
jgi:hypothetical protein